MCRYTDYIYIHIYTIMMSRQHLGRASRTDRLLLRHLRQEALFEDLILPIRGEAIGHGQSRFCCGTI